MDIVELLFGWVAKNCRLRKERLLNSGNQSVSLNELQARLTLLACAVTGARIKILPSEREGGYKGDVFFLPATCSLFCSLLQNTQFYLYRVLYLATQRKLNLNWHEHRHPTPEEATGKLFDRAQIILRQLFTEYPQAEPIYHELKAQLEMQTPVNKAPDLSWLYGKWMREEQAVAVDEILNFSSLPPSQRPNQVQTVMQSKPVEEVVHITIDKKQQEDYVLTHNFEKVETAEEFDGVWRDFDGDDELARHQEALSELKMKFAVRTDDTVHSVYQTDFLENTNVPESTNTEPAAPCLLYDEWDYTKRAYKAGFCKVYPQTQQETNSNFYCASIASNFQILTNLRKNLISINNKTRQQKRQTHGEDFDFDILTDLFVDVHSRHTPSDKVYLSKRKKEKELSILILLDISLSCDGYVNDSRIIDIEKHVAILFGEIMNEFQIDFSIHGFCSKTRNHSSYITLKGFDEQWENTRQKIGAIEPTGFTRIGAALRHSGALLADRSSRNKWLILISDGKPNDYDRYEGKYGIKDVKQALHELNQQHINSFALAVEATTRYYLPQMFGQNHYHILTGKHDLAGSFAALLNKIQLMM